ncbi:ricin B lectin domain-containing protein [Cyathus striatus]|nr:ricin B lectin domain-containing protein [Cyathus striatus]
MLHRVLCLTLVAILATVNATPTARAPGKGPALYACPNRLFYPNATSTVLEDATNFSQFWQCRYASGVYCFYDYMAHTLYHIPNTPIPGIDSDPACPNIIPNGQNYLIKSSLDTSKCVTTSSNNDGAPLQIRVCDGRHDYPGQKWFFDSANLVSVGTNKCIDVKDGVVANGVKLQTWTCYGGNTNQQSLHWTSSGFLVYPEDHIIWLANPWLCMDLTDGNLNDGTTVQMWSCDYPNPNQKWFLSAL